MGLGISVFVIALGAILTWAVTGSILGMTLDVIGPVLMVVGALWLMVGVLAADRREPAARS